MTLRLGGTNQIRAPLDLSEYEQHLRFRMNEGCGGIPLRRALGTDKLTGTLAGRHGTSQQRLQTPCLPPAVGLSIGMGETLPITVQPIPEGDQTRHTLPPDCGPGSWNPDQLADHAKHEIERVRHISEGEHMMGAAAGLVNAVGAGLPMGSLMDFAR